jgi:hypothetical protein
MEIDFPEIREPVVYETQMMREAIRRTISVYLLSALVVWYGKGRIGKTTTARYMVEDINKAYDPNNPKTFRAFHYVVGEILPGSGNEMKKGIRSLYQATLGIPLDEGFYRQNPPEAIALHLVHALRRKGIRVVIVDEAGLLSIKAIRGMTLVRDSAENEGWILTIVFVGMDDLPGKMIKNEQVHRRVLEWCLFEPFSLDETWELLEKLHPYFKNIDGRKQAHQELIKYIHDISGDLPGPTAALVEKLRYRLNNNKEEITVEFLKAINNVTEQSMIGSLNRSGKPYKGVPTKKTEADA